MKSSNLIEVESLNVSFKAGQVYVPVVKDISFHIKRGEVLALVGESGCGKTVTAMSLINLMGSGLDVLDGIVRLQPGNEDPIILPPKRKSREKIARPVRGKHVGVIFQEPMSSFSPLYTLGNQIAEPMITHKLETRPSAKQRVFELLEMVGVPEPAEAFKKYPFEYSGGQRQRGMIARALSCHPSLLIADEPTTALDVTIQAQILKLLKEIQLQTQMSVLFITHDLGVVAQFSHRTVVMYMGKIVEVGRVKDIFKNPLHPYTKALLESIPKYEEIGQHKRMKVIEGSVPNIFDRPPGCPFAPRCQFADPDACRNPENPLIEKEEEHFVACVHA